ncbi:PEP-CTERM sorting domain-containing protein [Dapis sp. BLCC M172]|uniref:PEP-CTERM sorting domain-containing protein n=1 Tax=Dapis sp. BLCC M172 TaxID=2975281 RepID=UPI003CEDE23A
MKINQFLQVVVVSSIMSVGFSSKLPVGAFVTNSTHNNNSNLATNSNSAGSSNLSQFLGETSQNSQTSTIDCNLVDKVKDYVGTPEPTLISGLFFVVGLGLWSRRKKIIK